MHLPKKCIYRGHTHTPVVSTTPHQRPPPALLAPADNPARAEQAGKPPGPDPPQVLLKDCRAPLVSLVVLWVPQMYLLEV